MVNFAYPISFKNLSDSSARLIFSKFSIVSSMAYENCVSPYWPSKSTIGYVPSPLLHITFGVLKCPLSFVLDQNKLIPSFKESFLYIKFKYLYIFTYNFKRFSYFRSTSIWKPKRSDWKNCLCQLPFSTKTSRNWSTTRCLTR